MTVIVDGAQTKFLDGKLALSYFYVSFSAGQYPNSLNGNLQITAEQGVTIESSQEQVAEVAKKVIQAMVADKDKQGAE